MIPVVVTHRGNQGHLHVVIHQAASYNERVILLGDESNENIPGAEHLSAQDLYTPEARLFESNYVHMHTKPSVAYRRANITRWFLIAELARQRDFPVVFACDSDLLLYTNVGVAEQVLGDYDLACSIPRPQHEFRWCAAGHATYWKRETLLEFCRFINHVYTDTTLLEALRKKWAWHQKTGAPGGICDMTLLWLYIQGYEVRAVDLCSPINETVFDHNFGESDGYRMAGAVKDIEWRDGQPFSYHTRLGWIRFNALHFQGQTKKVLGTYLRPKEAR